MMKKANDCCSVNEQEQKNLDCEKVLENDKNTWKYAHVSFKGKEDRTKLKGFTLQICFMCQL